MRKSSTNPISSGDLSEKWAPPISRDRKLLLADLVTTHRDILRSKHKDANTEKSKNAAWALITEAFNASSTDQAQTVNQIKRIWSKQASESRQQLTNFDKATKKTGGGPGDKIPDELCNKVSDYYGKLNPIISGCQGFESSITYNTMASSTMVDQNVDLELLSDNDDCGTTTSQLLFDNLLLTQMGKNAEQENNSHCLLASP